VLADVSSKLMDQFVQSLEADVLSTAHEAAVEEKAVADFEAAAETVAAGMLEGEVSEPAPPGPRRIDSRPAEPVDLLGTAGSPVLKRLLPVGGLLLVILLLLRSRSKRRGN
jgi:hypothetical protein